MLSKLLWADICKKKAIAFILMLFVMLSAFLITASTNMIISLSQALDGFFSKASVPHYAQLSEMPIEDRRVQQWAAQNKYVKKYQIVKMLLIDGQDITLGAGSDTEEHSVMNFDFTTQNQAFDFLLNISGERVFPGPGEVAVPIYFMQQHHLKVGDKLKVTRKNGHFEWTIVDFIRDSQMNPSIVHSKRFIINPVDFEALEAYTTHKTYLIEFQLNRVQDIRAFGDAYQASDLLQNGPILDYNLYKVLNSVTDGMTIGLIMLVSVLLTLIAVLCLRFTLLTTMEEDYRQIGIMKALGIPKKTIKNLYLAKYTVLAGVACVLGYLAALGLKKYFLANILLYLGFEQSGFAPYLVPLGAVVCIFVAIIVFCKWLLKRFDSITAVDALRSAVRGNVTSNVRPMSLRSAKWINLNILMGLKDLIEHYRSFILLFGIFSVCSFLVILPINFFNTLQSPNFVTYMGVGHSDMRIDLRHTEQKKHEFEKMVAYLAKDKDIQRYQIVTTARFKMLEPNGQTHHINIELGETSAFPIQYLQGRAPANAHEIALSYLNSKHFKKKIGEKVSILLDNHPYAMTVTGIYQDITNGGKTAKANLPYAAETVMWRVINMDFQPAVSVVDKKKEYARHCDSARVTDLQEYVQQTLGDLIQQAKWIALLACVIAAGICVLITSLFLKLLITKHYSQIAIMKALGFSLWDIRTQYLTRSLLVLNLGIIFGTLLCNTLGQKMVSAIWSTMGAAEITFVIDPLQVYVMCPLGLMAITSFATLASIVYIKTISIINMIVE